MLEKSFRIYLQEELLERFRRNPSYSLRSFSKSIGMSHATLSQILKGTRKLTPKTGRKIGESLGLSEAELTSFTEISGKNNTNDEPLPEKAYSLLKAAHFGSISDWYHDAILEMTALPTFQCSPSWIAKQLGISVIEARTAIERLKEAGCLKVQKNGKCLDASGDNTNIKSINHSDYSSRKLQKQILEKAIYSIDDTPVSNRDNTSVVLPIQKSDLGEVKKRIKKFRRELASFLERANAKPDEVYQLAIAFYPLTNINIEKEKI